MDAILGLRQEHFSKELGCWLFPVGSFVVSKTLINPKRLMDFDYLSEYKDFPTSHLLAIVQSPQDYQPEAVYASQTLLNDRQVSEADRMETGLYLSALAAEEEKPRRSINRLKAQAVGLLEPVMRPRAEVDPRKWVNLLLTVILVQFVWNLVSFSARLMPSSSRGGYDFSVSDIVGFLDLALTPVIWFLLYKRRKLGWISLMVIEILLALTSLSSFYYVFKYSFLRSANPGFFIWPVIFHSAFVVFLWRTDIAGYFGISEIIKKRTALGSFL
ncbi:MAG TPA: hypothetical protein VGM63_23720, partial [Mucilaginibacter sp.]